MADLKITELDALTPDAGDLVAVARTGSPASNGKVTLGDILDELSGLPAAPVSAGDYVLSLAGSPLAATWEAAESGGGGVPAAPETAGTYALVMSGSPLAASWDTIEGGSADHPYDMIFGFSGPLTEDAEVFRAWIATNCTTNADMAGSLGSCSPNPAASVVITVKDDGVTIGTLTYSTGGAASYTTVSGTAKAIAAGSLLTFHSAAGVDQTPTQFDGAIKMVTT